MKIKDKVLIVEDEQSISNFISMILQASGFDTIVVRTGEEALTMVSSHCPDLIILDLGLPDMDGMEVLKSVRKWSNLPVVVVSEEQVYLLLVFFRAAGVIGGGVGLRRG